MNDKNWSYLWHHNQLNLNFFQAFHSVHAYPRHSHDYYVVALVDRGIQSFSFAGNKHVTPVGGLILLNPGDVHTGEPVDEAGFGYCAFYPGVEHMATILPELGRHYSTIPAFSVPRADHIQIAESFRSLYAALKGNANPLECESKFIWMMVELIKQFGNKKLGEQKIGTEHEAIQKVRDYIHENYTQPITLSELADYVHLSRYYLLHTFRDKTGMPPHAYLENVRIRQAQKLLSEGNSLVEIAYQVGFGSQSHFTQRFKHIIGITPGEYAKQVNK